MKLSELLRSKKGETLVEILVSTVIVVVLLGVFGMSINFASNAMHKTDELRKAAYDTKVELRSDSVTWIEESRTSDTKLKCLNTRPGEATPHNYDINIGSTIKKSESDTEYHFKRITK